MDSQTYNWGDTNSAVQRAIEQGKAQDRLPKSKRGVPDGASSTVDPAVEALAQTEARAVGEDNLFPVPFEKGMAGVNPPQYTPQNEQVSPQSYDWGHGNTSPQTYDWKATESQPVRSTGGIPQAPDKPRDFHPGQILDWLMSPMDPELRTDVERMTGKSTLDLLHPSTWTLSNIGKSLAVSTADDLSTPMTVLLSPFVGKGMVNLVPKVPPIVKLTPELLDSQIAQRTTKPTQQLVPTGEAPIDTSLENAGILPGRETRLADLVQKNTPVLQPTEPINIQQAVFPSLYARISGSIIDALRSAGPVPRAIGDLADNAWTNAGVRTATADVDATKAMDAIFKRNNFLGKSQARAQQFSDGENAFIDGSRTKWNITQDIEEQAFNYMYTARRMVPSNPIARAYAEAVYNHFLYPASSDPKVRALPGVKDSFTGKHTPFGEPGMFAPQQPVSPVAIKNIKDAQWEILYARRGGENLGIDWRTFKDTVIARSRNNPEVTAGKALGLENDRLLDLEALGGSPYKWAKIFGYRTDPYAQGFMYHRLATLRGELNAIEQPINDLESIIHNNPDLREWISNAKEHILLSPNKKYDATSRTTEVLKTVSHLMDLTMLQKGWLANLAQPSYIVSRAGPVASIKGMFNYMTGRERDLIVRSGADLPTTINSMTNPTGPLATFSSGAFNIYGLKMVDRFTRWFAGHAGNEYIKSIEKNLLANPTSKSLQNGITQLGGNVQELLTTGKIDDATRLAMIQRFANYTAGVTDARGMPLWASSQNPWFRLINKYRSFAQANSAEVRRQVFEAPSVAIGIKRAVTLLSSATVLGGGLVKGVNDGLTMLLSNDPGIKTKGDLWNKLEPLIYGLGTLEGSMVMNAARDIPTAVSSAIGGPAAGTVINLAQDLKRTYDHGIGWRSIRTLSRMVPVVGPVIGPLVKEQVNKERTATNEQERLLRE